MRYHSITLPALVYLTVLLILSFAGKTMAAGQPPKNIETVLRQTNVGFLRHFSLEKEKKYQKNKAKAIKLAKEKGWFLRREVSGRLMELQGVSVSGNPLYYITHNRIAAQSTSTDKVYPGGDAGLNLDGSGMIAGEWDAAGVRLSHQEFNNTGTARVIQKDSPSQTHAHSTHVAGTLVAGGVEANAQGMAYNAILHAYDWNSDGSEMAAAAADGLLVSNHSYGYSAGWLYNGSSWVWTGDTSISSEEDFQFGFYSDLTRELDTIAFNAPYYLIVKSAGNDRGDGAGQTAHPVDGYPDGYDCIGYKGNAKNILTVGAVYDIAGGYSQASDVKMTTFSSWGPTDDGRIKPDICGNGYLLYSSSNDNDADYVSMSGTSMSSPNVTGSLLLLQEHFHDLYGGYMKAATLKALVLHTADEAGPADGPDFMFGWGILNTARAAAVISDKDLGSLIQEDTYHTGSPYNLQVTAKGTEPLVVTLVWTDPPGTPVADQLDPPDIMLVNDLDMTVTDGSTIWQPYILDGTNPSAAATTGDNDVDNVEKIVLPAPDAGSYTITISHEGVLAGGSQTFSLIVTGLATGHVFLTTHNAESISQTSVVLGGTAIEGNSPVTERGVVWGTAQNPTTADNKTSLGTGPGSFSGTITDLSPATRYHHRAYAVDSDGTAYGTDRSFTTLCEDVTVFPWAESFSEDSWPPQCWTVYQRADSNTGWQRYATATPPTGGHIAPYSSPGSAFHDDDNVASGVEDWLVSPRLDFSNKTSAALKFREAGYYQAYYEYHGVWVSTNSNGDPGNGTWIQLHEGDVGETWRETSLDLSMYDGEPNVHVGFKYTGDYADEWYIDDVLITVAPRTYDLTIDFQGNGSGTVKLTPPDVDLSDDGNRNYTSGTAVTLTATAGADSIFSGWSGDADCSDGQVSMTAAHTCIATFALKTFELTVDFQGSGNGTVQVAPPDVTLTSYGIRRYSHGTAVTLTAVQGNDSIFTGWSGACFGTSPCTVLMNQARNVTATFTRTFDPTNALTVSLDGNGSGTVTSEPTGIFCTTAGSSCAASFAGDTFVTLTAVPAEGALFSSWSGDCTGSNSSCTVQMDQNRSAVAVFTPQIFELTITREGKGDGTVTSTPAGIHCNNDCRQSYDYGTRVVLTADPDGQSTFAGWRGSCNEPLTVLPKPTCVVDIRQSENVSVSFDRIFSWPMFLPVMTRGEKN